jgi:hypothetical protein
MDLQGAASALSGIPLDWIVIGAFFIIVLADALRAGSTRAAALSLSLPIAYFLYQMVSQTALLGSLTAPFSGEIAQAIIFAVIEAVLFVCCHQMFFSYDRSTSLFSAAIAGFAATAVVLVVWTETPVLQSLWHFGPVVGSIFGASYRFFWLIAAYFALAFVGS